MAERDTSGVEGPAVYVCVEDLDLSIAFQFASEPEQRDALEAIQHEPVPIRMPPYRLSDSSAFPTRSVVCVGYRTAAETATVEWSGDIEIAPYVTLRRRFYRDFWKVALALVSRAALHDRIVTLHAAFVRDQSASVLVVGGSGAGKSSIAIEASRGGASVLATELVFASAGRFVAGNGVLDIPEVTRQSRADDDRFVFDTVSSTVFPRIHNGDLKVNPLNPARARALLFENAMTMTGVATLLGHDLVPLPLLLRREHLELVAEEVRALAQQPAYICAGRPSDIWTFCRSNV